jgi:DNA gyrase subunit A
VNPSGIEVMTAEGKWISAEEDMFGADWQTKIEPWVIRFNEMNGDSAITHLSAIETIESEGCSADIIDFICNELGMVDYWWDFMLGTGEPVLAFATCDGFCKATKIEDFHKIQRNGKIAIEIRNDDKLLRAVKGDRFTIDGVDVSVRLKEAKEIEKESKIKITERINEFVDEFADFIFLSTANGLAVKFPLHELKPRGRASKGLLAINLKDGDKVVGFDIVTNDDDIVLVTENGIGKRVKVKDFRNMRRGAVGVKCLNTSHKTGKVVAALSVKNKNDELLFMTSNGQMIRLASMNIPAYKRQAKGVSLMKIRNGEKLISGEVIDESLQKSN